MVTAVIMAILAMDMDMEALDMDLPTHSDMVTLDTDMVMFLDTDLPTNTDMVALTKRKLVLIFIDP
jgi:hypothetical protein